MAVPVDIQHIADFKIVKNRLESRWLELETVPNAFRYKLNIRRERVITNGPFNALIQLNIERSTKRRPPQKITSIVQPFDANAFNFNKVNDCEILFKCNYRPHRDSSTTVNTLITFLINNSPLTKYHTLICPNLSDNLSQILTRKSIQFAIDVLQGFGDKYYRIGFNSMGAFASVNHLHMHLMYIETDLFVETVEIEHVVGNVYKLGSDFPVIGFCFLVEPNNVQSTDSVSSDINKLVEYFCDKSIPHNLFWTFAPYQYRQYIKVFVYPRAHMTDKISSEFNVAFCELSGYVPIGDSELFESLTGDRLNTEILKTIGRLDKESLISEIIKLYSE